MERFWRKVTKSDDCWVWQGDHNTQGYGRVSFGTKRKGYTNYRMKLAHRLSYELANGPIPEGLNVLHKCDNPPCVRPDHLFLGTNQDNNTDMVRKGRHRGAKGERNTKAKLTAEDVLEIRRLSNLGTSQRGLVSRFAVCQTTISRILLKQTWRHV